MRMKTMTPDLHHTCLSAALEKEASDMRHVLSDVLQFKDQYKVSVVLVKFFNKYHVYVSVCTYCNVVFPYCTSSEELH